MQYLNYQYYYDVTYSKNICNEIRTGSQDTARACGFWESVS